MGTDDPLLFLLLYFILPVWLMAGFCDWLCHRASHIHTTTGQKESLIHLLMFIEMGIPLLAALFLEINALVLIVMIVLFFVHEATALWDVSYAVTARRVSPVEQHVHSFLEMVPLMALLLVISRHWGQFLSVFGRGPEIKTLSLLAPRQHISSAPFTAYNHVMNQPFMLVIPSGYEFSWVIGICQSRGGSAQR